MTKYMKKPEFVEAEQWFPDRKVAGVVGATPGMLCGCVIIGGPSNEPHIHLLSGQAVVVNPSDWIVTDPNGGRHVYGPDYFSTMFQLAPQTVNDMRAEMGLPLIPDADGGDRVVYYPPKKE